MEEGCGGRSQIHPGTGRSQIHPWTYVKSKVTAAAAVESPSCV